MSYPTAYSRRTGNDSLFRGLEQQTHRGFEQQTDSPLRRQAVELLTSSGSRAIFQSGRSETGSEGLPPINVSGRGAGKITEDQAVTVGGSSDAIKAMNPDGDQTKQMLNFSPTAELFMALKEQNPQEAKDFAVRNTAFHRQSMNDMGDLAFQEDVRLRLTGEIA